MPKPASSKPARRPPPAVRDPLAPRRSRDKSRLIERDPEKWIPIFGKDHAPLKCQSANRFRSKHLVPKMSPFRYDTPGSGPMFEIFGPARDAARHSSAWAPQLGSLPEKMNNTRALASPTFSQLAVLPVPENVKHQLHGSSRRITDRRANAQVSFDVLPVADRHLHLRQQVPVCLCSSGQISVGQKLHHRRP